MALEVSRLARNNADWYRLLDLAGMTDTLIADADGVYHPGLFNDRMLLGMKGTMSEAELHILRARLDGGIRSKAARGELRRGLPVGLVWGEADGEIRWHPDEAVTGVIAAIFDRFAVCGSVRGVWLWLREQGLKFPLQRPPTCAAARSPGWSRPTMRCTTCSPTPPTPAPTPSAAPASAASVDADGRLRVCRRVLPQASGRCSSPSITAGSSTGTRSRPTRSRIRTNIRPRAHQPGTGAVREGCALLQGLATCGTCGRKLAVYYDGPAKTTPGYYCTGTGTADRGQRHPPSARRRRRDRRRGRRGVPGRAAAGGAAGLPGRRPAARRRPRRRVGAVAPPGRAGAL